MKRRTFLRTVGAAGIVAAGGVAAYRGLHKLPPRDAAADQEFRSQEEALLRASGVDATLRFVDVRQPALRVAVVEAGRGDPVLFIHGGNSVALSWLPLLARLQTRFGLIAPDRPGCGLTTQFSYVGVDLRTHGQDFIGGLLDALALPRASLVGNSIGGYFALAFALAQPDRVGKLVLIGEPAGSGAVVSRFHRLVGTRGINTLLYSTVLRPPRDAAAARKGLARAHLVVEPDRVPDALLACLAAAARLPGAVEAWITMVERAFDPPGSGLFARRTTLTNALRSELPRLATPTLFVWGTEDPFGAPSVGRELAALMPNARVHVVDGAGHLPWLDRPDECATEIASFLGG